MADVLGLLISLVGVVYLSLTNDKRRRTFRQAPFTGERHVLAARIAVFGPGVAFALAGKAGGFTLWLGGVSVLGWALVSLPPKRWEWLKRL